MRVRVIEYKVNDKLEVNVEYRWVNDEVKVDKVCLGFDNITPIVDKFFIVQLERHIEENQEEWLREEKADYDLEAYKEER